MILCRHDQGADTTRHGTDTSGPNAQFGAAFEPLSSPTTVYLAAQAFDGQLGLYYSKGELELELWTAFDGAINGDSGKQGLLSQVPANLPREAQEGFSSDSGG